MNNPDRKIKNPNRLACFVVDTRVEQMKISGIIAVEKRRNAIILHPRETFVK
jgi:hypothetical protein